MKRYLLIALVACMALGVNARTFEAGEHLYFNATPESASWWKDGTYENTIKLWGRLVEGSHEYWIEAKWYNSSNCYLEIPDDANATGRSWSKLILYRCAYNNRNDVKNKTGEINIDANYDKNYLQNFYYGTYKEEANWWNLTLVPSGAPGTTVDGIAKETVSVCKSSVGDPLSLQPKLTGSSKLYDYNNSAANAWFKWNGTAWVALDGQKTGFYSGNNAWGYEGGTNIKETIGAVGSHTYYFLWTEKASLRRFVEVVVDRDCEPTCAITDFGVVTSTVNAHDSTYVLDGIVAFGDANGKTLRISVTDAKGEHSVEYVNPVTPKIFSLEGLFAAGTKNMVAKAEFLSTSYSATATYDAPNAITGIKTHDFTITPDETKQLKPATDGSGGFIWSDPSITDHDPVVGPYNFDTTLIYIYYEYETPPTVAGNLIENGDFSADASFYGTINRSNTITGSAISQYNFWGKDVTDESNFYDTYKDAGNAISGGFSIVKDANKFWKRFTKKIAPKKDTHYALFDADNSGTKKAWFVTTTKSPKLTLAKGTNYMFSFWVANINNYGEMNNAAKLQFAIRYKQGGSWSAEELLGNPIDLNMYKDNIWHQNSHVFTSPVDATDVEIMVRDLNASANPGGNDFALDDIQFQPISVVSQAIKNCERFVVKIYEQPTVVQPPVVDITRTPACRSNDFAMDVTVKYSTLNNKFTPITLTLTDNIYGELVSTNIDPAVNPDSITLSLATETYAMLKADGKTHTLTAKISRIDGAGVDKGGQNSSTYVSPGIPDIDNPVLTELNKACDKTTYDLQVAVDYRAFKGTKLHYEWDGAEWTDADLPALSYKESLVQTATGKLKNLVADDKAHTLRIYSDNAALDCDTVLDVTAFYSPYIATPTATVLPAECGDATYQVEVAVTFANGQGHKLIIEDWNGNKETIPTGAADTQMKDTFAYAWETPTSHAFKVYFECAGDCANNHVATFTSPLKESCVKDSATICEGNSYSWHGVDRTGSVGENVITDGTDTLWLFVKEKPSLKFGKVDMTCDQSNEVRLPITEKKGNPDLFDVTIDGKPIPGCAIKGSDFVIPLTGLEAGDHTGSVAVQETGLSCDSTTSFSFSVAISNQMFSKWTDVLFINNKGDKYKAFQWFADGAEMKDETQQRLYDPKGLSGSATVYYCRLTTTDGKTLYTCPMTFDQVTPSRTQNTGENKVQSTRIYDTMGRSITGAPHNGIYIIVEQLEDGDTRVRKIIK